MKIIKILNGNDEGGVYTSERNYILNLKNRGVYVLGIILGEGNSFNEYKNIVNEYILLTNPNIQFSGSLIKILKNINLGQKHAKSNLKEIVHFLKGANFNAIVYRKVTFHFIAGWLGKQLSLPVFWHMPNIISNNSSYIFHQVYLRLLKIQPIANSEYTQKTIGKICKYVVYPGFNPQKILGGEKKYREMLKIGNDKPVFGIIARVEPYKAQDIVVKAFIRSDAISKGGHLLIAGGYKNKIFFDRVKEEAGEYWNKRIHYLEKISDTDNFFASIDIMINGRTNAEPFGISIAEALGAGKPIISYYLGGPSETVIEDYTGWLVKEPNEHEYSKAINLCLKNQDKWSILQQNCIKHAERFTVNTNVSKLISILSKE